MNTMNRLPASMKSVERFQNLRFHRVPRAAGRFTGFTERSDSSSGFGLVETVVGVAVLAAVLLGLAQVGQFTLRVVAASNLRLRAAFLAEEGIEVARILRDSGWGANIGPKALCTDYYLSFFNGTWQITAMPVSLVDGIFDRRVRFEAVARNAAQDIIGASCSSSGSDPDTRKVDVTVQWTNRNQASSMAVSTYLANIFSN